MDGNILTKVSTEKGIDSMKLKAGIKCPHCYECNGFDLELEDINTKVIAAHCKECGSLAFKIYAFSIVEVDKNGQVINDVPQP